MRSPVDSRLIGARNRNGSRWLTNEPNSAHIWVNLGVFGCAVRAVGWRAYGVHLKVSCRFHSEDPLGG